MKAGKADKANWFPHFLSLSLCLPERDLQKMLSGEETSSLPNDTSIVVSCYVQEADTIDEHSQWEYRNIESQLYSGKPGESKVADGVIK